MAWTRPALGGILTVATRGLAGPWLVGCAPAPGLPVDRFPTDSGPATDTGPASEDSDPGWELGTASGCSDPVPAAWRDASDLLDRSTLAEGRPQHGGLVVTPHGDTWLIAGTFGIRDVGVWSLDGAFSTLAPGSRPAVHAVSHDIDGDGRLDLFTMGDHLEVRWDWTTLDSPVVPLSEGAEWTSHQDVSVVDIDGDGQTELLLGVWRDRWSGLERWDVARGMEPLQTRGTVLADTGTVFDQVILDFNGDGAPDVYTCNDTGAEHGGNILLLNDGAGGLVEATPPGAGLVMDCMSVSAGDVNGDGQLDLLLSGLARTALLIATEDGFVDVARAWGIEMPSWEKMDWGSDIADLDNDGLPDMIVNRSGFSPEDPGTAPPDVLRQSAPGVLQPAPWGISPPRSTRNTVTVDLNNDGVLDVVYLMLDGAPELYLSEGCTAGAWLEIDAPEGTIARVEAGGRTWAMPVTGQPGFGASRPTLAHIGLGDVDVIDRVTLAVPWQSRPVVLNGPVQPRQRLRWRAGEADARTP